MLREVLALEDGQARPAMSTVFSAPRGTFAADLLGAAPTRPPRSRAGGRGAAGAAGRPHRPGRRPARPPPAASRCGGSRRPWPQPGPEVRLALARAELAAGDPAAALVELAAAAADDPDDWRIDWYRGVAALFTDPADAVAAFDRAYLTFPGEHAPKLALAVAAECAGDDERARRYYALLTRIEPSLADAAFGLARTALRAGDRATAVAALDAVPDTSSRHVAAQLAAIDATLAGRTGPEIGDADLRAAAARVPGSRWTRAPPSTCARRCSPRPSSW